MAKKEIEFTAMELWQVRSLLGSSTGVNIADQEHRLKLFQLLDFTAEEREAISYEEILLPNGQMTIKFNGLTRLSRGLTAKQRQKLRDVVLQNAHAIEVARWPLIREGLIKLGWIPDKFDEDEDEEDEE